MITHLDTIAHFIKRENYYLENKCLGSVYSIYLSCEEFDKVNFGESWSSYRIRFDVFIYPSVIVTFAADFPAGKIT